MSGRETVMMITGAVISFADGAKVTPAVDKITKNGDDITVCCGGDRLVRAELSLVREGEGVAAKIELEASETLAAENTVELLFETGRLTGAVTIHPTNIWWTYPSFSRNKAEWHEKNQLADLQASNAQKVCFLPLVGDDFSTYIGKNGIDLSVGAACGKKLSGAFMMITASDGPIKAVSSAYKTARSAGHLKVPLMSEKKVPEFADHFGWCSWNATYQDVTEEKLVAKMEEFKEKKIPVGWVIIDDGWQDRRDNKLWDFEADKAKFPSGLKHAVDIIKSYGDVKVGIWHTLNVYWSGIAPGSPVAEKYADRLTFLEGGQIIPSLDPEKAYLFWKDYHAFLRSCGIDFLKVDNQGSYMDIVRGHAPTASATRNAHFAIERSVAEAFGDVNGALKMIDCMGEPEENILGRPLSSVNRNSDDFFPDKPNGFVDHIVQNAWNAPWHSMMYLCDFDMWWSRHESADQSAILRAISGGPVYVSDKIGESEPDVLRPLMDNSGRLYRFPHAAMPTVDCFFTDCAASGVPLKLFNRCGDNFAAAAWDISGGPVEDELSVSDVPGIDSGVKYLAYEYFSKKSQRFDLEHSIRFSLEKNGVLAWSIFPIRDGKVRAAGLDKYFPAAIPADGFLMVSDLV